MAVDGFDQYLVSIRNWELETILRHYNKSTSESNKAFLIEVIRGFKTISALRPYTRQNLYNYMEPDYLRFLGDVS